MSAQAVVEDSAEAPHPPLAQVRAGGGQQLGGVNAGFLGPEIKRTLGDGQVLLEHPDHLIVTAGDGESKRLLPVGTGERRSAVRLRRGAALAAEVK